MVGTGVYQSIWSTLSQMVHDIPEYEHMFWHHQLITHETNLWSVTELDCITEFDIYQLL